MSARLRRRALDLVVIAALFTLGCERSSSAPEGTTRVFLGERPVASVHERRSGLVVERESRLEGLPNDLARLTVTLDERGFVREARYERRGPRGEREVSLVVDDDGVATLRTPQDAYVLSRGRPVVLLETLHLLSDAHRALERPQAVAFIDLSAGEVLLGSVRREGDAVVALDEHGALLARTTRQPPGRVGPGRFVERAGTSPSSAAPLHPPASTFPGPARTVRLLGLDEIPPAALALDGPGQQRLEAHAQERAGELRVRLDRAIVDTTPPDERHTAPAPFLESDDEAVRAFALRHASKGTPAADALELAEAIHVRLDTRGGGGPPSALRTLSTWSGDCDDATALLVAALRARGYPSRPVVGYRHHGGELVPHAWAEVHDGSAWLPVDALVPGLGPFSTHLRLFEGLGSSLTMGRVLGALRVELSSPNASSAVSSSASSNASSLGADETRAATAR